MFLTNVLDLGLAVERSAQSLTASKPLPELGRDIRDIVLRPLTLA